MRADELLPPDMLALKPGDQITKINGADVKNVKNYYLLDRALQESDGEPVMLTVVSTNGEARKLSIRGHFEHPFGKDEPLNFAGMIPRPEIELVQEKSPVRGKILPGDVITSISSGGEAKNNPTPREFMDWLNKAGANDETVNITVLRNNKLETIEKITPSFKVPTGLGLGVGLGSDDDHAVVADTREGSPARAAGIPAESTIVSINGEKVSSWYDVRRFLMSAKPGEAVSVIAKKKSGDEGTYKMTLDDPTLVALDNQRLATNLRLSELTEPRKTSNPLIAAQWGVVETRDFIVQFYLTMSRMFQGSVSYTNMMGPVGIFHAGTKLAYKGYDWLVWFLSMISANLAVVNFLPIPIVDGGLFTFLILEKIKGSPLSPRAQSIAQVVGLALLVGVFLLVTYQDINRLF
jgi:regulator of sigma E protease